MSPSHKLHWWYHPLQLVLVVLFHPATSANTALALCGGGTQLYVEVEVYAYETCTDTGATCASVQ